jgi:iron complex outermembrane receptor protein
MLILNNYRNSSIKSVAVFLFLTIIQIFGESRGISGIVIDSESNKQIPNVTIRIIETDKRITSNNNGEFHLNDIEFGEYTFVLTHIIYQENISKVIIAESTNKVIVFYLIPKLIELDAVIISDYKTYSKFDDMKEVSNVLKGKELQKQLGLTLASTLKNEAGLAMRSMGPAPSRPVIRGLGASRVLISEDNIKTTDLSATSPDHAVTIDPFSVSRIEVLRGPKILLQTSTTMGGVVNVIKEEIPQALHDNLTGQFGMYGESVNEGYLGSIMLEAPLNPFVVKGQISRRKTNDMDTPNGKLKNSDSENLNYNLASSYIFNKGFIGTSYSRFELDYGVPGGFVGAHPNGVDINMYKNQMDLKSKYSFDSQNLEDVTFNLSRVFYRHKEFEASGALGSEFRIINYLGDAKLHHNHLGFLDHGTLGLSFEYRDFDIGGFVFTSPSKSLNISAHIFEIYSIGNLNFEFGGRYEFDKITPVEENPNAKIGYIKERNFNNYSLSASILYQQSEHVYFGANISKSSRVPTIEELYSDC